MEGNGQGTKEDILEIDEVQTRIRNRFENTKDEGNNIENSIEELYDRIFDGKQYSKSELNGSNEIVKERIESIIGSYSEKDFYVFDFEEKKEHILNAKEVKTGILEKVAYNILSIDRKTQEKFVHFLEKKYLINNETDLAKKVIENEEMIISREAKKYHTLENRVEKDKDYLAEERKRILNKLWDCRELVEKSTDELEDYKKKIVEKQEEIEAAYKMEDGQKFISILDKEKGEFVDEAREAKRMMVKTANYMERLNNLVDDISEREESITAFYESLMGKRMNIELIYDFLEIARKQMDIGFEIENYNPDTAYTREALERGINLIKNVDKLNKEIDKGFKDTLKKNNTNIDAYLSEKKTNFDNDTYMGDVKDIKARVNEIISYREKKEHERIKRVI